MLIRDMISANFTMKSGDQMQINRLFEIVYILLNKKNTTARELAERFEVSVRTIYRDIDALSAAGIPVYSSQGKGGGISLLDDFILDKSILSEGEQNEIIYALQSLAAVQSPESDQILSKLSNLFNKDNISWIEVDFSPWGSGESSSAQFKIIKDAILGRHILEFTYTNTSGEKSMRRVEPLKLIFKVNAWYLKGFCLTKNAVRSFKISRTANMRMTPENFEERSLETVPSADNGDMAQRWIDVRLWIAACSAYRVYDEFDEKDIIINSDGSFTVNSSLPESSWLIRYLLSFSADLEVLAPPELRETIRNESAKIVKRYET